MIYQKRRKIKIIKRWHVTNAACHIFTCSAYIQIIALSCNRKIFEVGGLFVVFPPSSFVVPVVE